LDDDSTSTANCKSYFDTARGEARISSRVMMDIGIDQDESP